MAEALSGDFGQVEVLLAGFMEEVLEASMAVGVVFRVGFMEVEADSAGKLHVPRDYVVGWS